MSVSEQIMHCCAAFQELSFQVAIAAVLFTATFL